MAGQNRIKPIALALASAAFFSASAFAQGSVTGPVRQYERPAPQTPRTGVNRVGTVVGQLNETPRFIVEAVNFLAVDTSGANIPFSADEVFGQFSAGGFGMNTSTFGGIDNGEGGTFSANQNCILPAVDPDGRRNGVWGCDRNGVAGPINFHVRLRDEDIHWGALTGDGVDWCINTVARDDDLGNCALSYHTMLFDHQYAFTTSEIIQHLDPSCRCWVLTARSNTGDTIYEMTVRITRVDQGGSNNAGMAMFDDDPVVYRSGNLNVRATQYLELDAGTAVPAGGDFLFTEVSNSNYRLTPSAGAKIWVGDANPRGYAACFAERGSANYVTTGVGLPAIGSYACYVTSDGRVGEMRIISVTPSAFGGNDLLAISYTTWQ